MPKTKHFLTEPPIVGDVNVESVTVNKKGGSLSAIFKKSLQLDPGEDAQWYGAKIEVEPGVAGVLVVPGRTTTQPKKFRVTQFASGVMINLEDEKEKGINPTVAAVLSVFGEMLKVGELPLDTPEESNRISEEAEVAGKKLEDAMKEKDLLLSPK
ncbi:MAG: hypothetical protein JOY96_04200 [Verrucomicrobia bacterium]|nr:hypothetical protein [Verrucomicrobiota bacterium]